MMIPNSPVTYFPTFSFRCRLDAGAAISAVARR
jgi:hypothetical protein